LIESTLKQFEFQEPALFKLCGETNLALGYLLIAEQMYTRCSEHAGHQAECWTKLAEIAMLQGDPDKALRLFEQSFERERTWRTAH
jgi:tetratricopeptide (TPR) repeat protein